MFNYATEECKEVARAKAKVAKVCIDNRNEFEDNEDTVQMKSLLGVQH